MRLLVGVLALIVVVGLSDTVAAARVHAAAPQRSRSTIGAPRVAGPRAPRPFTIDTSHRPSIWLAARSRILLPLRASLQEFREAFGPPSKMARRGPHDPYDCDVAWASVGVVRALFQDFGLPPNATKPCVPATSMSGATLVGYGWHTSDGLRIGNSLGRLLRLYPAAKADGCYPPQCAGTMYTIFKRRDPLGGPGAYDATLTAVVDDDVVVFFLVTRGTSE